MENKLQEAVSRSEYSSPVETHINLLHHPVRPKALVEQVRVKDCFAILLFSGLWIDRVLVSLHGFNDPGLWRYTAFGAVSALRTRVDEFDTASVAVDCHHPIKGGWLR